MLAASSDLAGDSSGWSFVCGGGRLLAGHSTQLAVFHRDPTGLRWWPWPECGASRWSGSRAVNSEGPGDSAEPAGVDRLRVAAA